MYTLIGETYGVQRQRAMCMGKAWWYAGCMGGMNFGLYGWRVNWVSVDDTDVSLEANRRAGCWVEGGMGGSRGRGLGYERAGDWYRVLHTLACCRLWPYWGPVVRPHWNNIAQPSCHAKYLLHPLQIYGWVICLKSIAHGSKCPTELCLSIDVGRKFSWLMKIFSKFPLHLWDAANEVIKNCTCLHVNIRHEICQDSRHQIYR